MESKNKLINLAIITGTFIICVIIIMLLANILSIMKYKDATFYVIDNDKIPTITTVVGKRKLYYYKNYTNSENDTKIFKYKNAIGAKYDINDYINFLKEKYNFVYTSNINLNSDDGKIQLSKDSVDDNEIIIMDITYNKDSYEIKITKGLGKLNF